jgi:hypothetical protein
MKTGLWTATAALLTMACAPGPAAAGTETTSQIVSVTSTGPGVFEFTQAGYSDGASVSGFFKGVDTNGDGRLQNFGPGEITDFGMTFSGNALVSAFSIGFANDFFFFSYDLDGAIGDDFQDALQVLDAPTYYFINAGEPCVGVCGQVIGPTPSPAVPEPTTWSMMLLGFGGLGAMLRRAPRRSARVA